MLKFAEFQACAVGRGRRVRRQEPRRDLERERLGLNDVLSRYRNGPTMITTPREQHEVARPYAPGSRSRRAAHARASRGPRKRRSCTIEIANTIDVRMKPIAEP